MEDVLWYKVSKCIENIYFSHTTQIQLQQFRKQKWSEKLYHFSVFIIT
ncbi:hypothetical protein NMBM6190_0759 [Neisseria meningitidis M6190]|nr:hypothetical protein NMBG2136_0884 [Neisseria meningitidis G2136]ADZ02163.1 hypothetical protein NMBM04240196_1735 [Neisseria meningitidis M04-240196]EGC55051.1 hypothetical protein NMBM6190_0759 [Neisseria meningitidis M6190]EGC56234.1 hypothetical protein NMBM13399_1776 [Neisseria meningitidis M13399]EGC61025.1 hypothetical protein NMBES14902_0827 [Neisseria meningitidis ES14902]EGC64576.1 hypothetical protein NMB9615945_1224 [Neisseria meningitidis 961-5945]EGC66114.1 hypothetical prote